MVKIRISEKEHLRWLRERRIQEILNRKVKTLNLKEHISSMYNSFFASSHGYPLIANGITVNQNPLSFSSLYNKSYEEVISYFSLTTFARKLSSVEKVNETLKYISMSIKPISLEIIFSKKPLIRFDLSSITSPIGPRAPLKKLREEENPKIPGKVYSLGEEKVKAKIALEELYSRNFNENYLVNLLSSGSLGENKKIVPTRWAITAVDSSLSDFNISIIRDFKEIENIEVYVNEHFSNKFIIIFLPGIFEFENFESWAPKTSWGAKSNYYISEEYQSLKGRKTYPYSQAGAYYAVLFSTTEFLRKKRRQARIVVIREVSEGYQIPLGVWHVRETVKRALEKPPYKFIEEKELFSFLSKNLSLPISLYLKKSKILGQKKITHWI